MNEEVEFGACPVKPFGRGRAWVRQTRAHVNQGVFEIFMTEQDLKGTEIGAGLV